MQNPLQIHQCKHQCKKCKRVLLDDKHANIKQTTHCHFDFHFQKISRLHMKYHFRWDDATLCIVHRNESGMQCNVCNFIFSHSIVHQIVASATLFQKKKWWWWWYSLVHSISFQFNDKPSKNGKWQWFNFFFPYEPHAKVSGWSCFHEMRDYATCIDVYAVATHWTCMVCGMSCTTCSHGMAWHAVVSSRHACLGNSEFFFFESILRVRRFPQCLDSEFDKVQRPSTI